MMSNVKGAKCERVQFVPPALGPEDIDIQVGPRTHPGPQERPSFFGTKIPVLQTVRFNVFTMMASVLSRASLPAIQMR